MKIEFIGYNNGKAMAVYNCKNMFWPLIVSFTISAICTVIGIVFSMYELFIFWIAPIIFLFGCLLSVLLIKYTDKVFLKESKTKHKFIVENGTIYKDSKEIKNKDAIKLYKFRKFLFLELKKSYYIIHNSDFIEGSREELLSQIIKHRFHRIQFVLPKKTKEEIIELMFQKISLEGKCRLFYSKDKTRIIYIYKNSANSFSIGYERLTIADSEEQEFLHDYGWWEPSMPSGSFSFFDSEEYALNEIKNQLVDYIEFK